MCKNVLYIGGFELPDKNAAAQRVIANAKILRDLGFNVYFIGINRCIDKAVPILDTKKEYYDFTCYSIPYPHVLSDWIMYLTSIRYIYKINLQNIDLIIVYNFPTIALFKLYKYAMRNKIKIIADVTEWYGLTGSFVFKILKYIDTELRMRFMHCKLNGVIAISRYLYDYYSYKGCRTLLLPPLVDKMDDKWSYVSSKKEDNIIYIVYAGSPGSGNKDKLDKIIKGLDYVERKKECKIRLNVIGITKDEYKKVFNDFEEYDFVNFLGRLSHVKTITQIKDSDFLIFVRDNNLVNTAGFPTKFVEAISCGIPVLTNVTSNIGDYVVEGQNAYLLDMTNENVFNDTLYHAITMGKSHIKEMKKYCQKSTIFDYRNYIIHFKSFLDDIFMR